MKERILEFLRKENKTSAQLADDIGVQASGISHILSGRNNPSLDFILKMLEKYKFLSTEWLLFGRGSMYKDATMQTLFDFGNQEEKTGELLSSQVNGQKSTVSFQETRNVPSEQPDGEIERPDTDVVKIVWFYRDNTFEEFSPR